MPVSDLIHDTIKQTFFKSILCCLFYCWILCDIIEMLHLLIIFLKEVYMSGQFCQSCGSSIPQGSSFCSNCGSSSSGNSRSTSYSTPSQPQVNYYNTPPTYQGGYQGVSAKEKPLTTKEFLIMLILMAIPLVNIIMLFIWAFGSEANLNKKSFARASFILFLIIMGLYLVFFILALVFGFLAGGLGGML